MGGTALRRLAAFGIDLRPGDVPDAVLAKARDLMFDHVGTVHAGQRVPEVARIVELIRSRRSDGNSTVLSAGFRTHVADAAFANGVAADVLEHQDGYRFGGFHPSHSLPAMVAVAEREDAGLDELLLALVVAYEVANRIGAAQHPGATQAGWFPTAAAFGAAVGCARLMGLDVEGAANALGATAFAVPGVMIESIFAGPSAKPTFAGYIARAGAEGALLAEAGLTGWQGALEDPRGLITLTGGSAEALMVGVQDVGTRWTVLDVHQKLYAACRHTHSAAQAAVVLAADHDLSAVDVRRVDVETYSVAKLLVDRAVPADAGTTACTLSLPYVVAAAIADRTVTGAQYAPDRIADPQIRRIADLVTTTVVDDLDLRYPEFTASRVTIETTDGAIYVGEVDLPTGDSRAPLSRTAQIEKFYDSFAATVPRPALQNIVTILLDADTTVPVRHLVSALTEATSTQE